MTAATSSGAEAGNASGSGGGVLACDIDLTIIQQAISIEPTRNASELTRAGPCGDKAHAPYSREELAHKLREYIIAHEHELQVPFLAPTAGDVPPERAATRLALRGVLELCDRNKGVLVYSEVCIHSPCVVRQQFDLSTLQHILLACMSFDYCRMTTTQLHGTVC